MAVVLWGVAYRRRWAVCVGCGAGVLFRPHLVVVGLVLALLVVAVRRAAVVGAGGGAVAYLVWNRVQYGRWSVLGGYAGGSHGFGVGGVGLSGFVDNVAGVVLSPGRGVLVWTPVVAVGVWGAWLARGRLWQWWGSRCAVAGLAYLVVQLWMERYSGGTGFLGYRVGLECLVLCGPWLLRGVVRVRYECGDVLLRASVSWGVVVMMWSVVSGLGGRPAAVVQPWVQTGLVWSWGAAAVVLGLAVVGVCWSAGWLRMAPAACAPDVGGGGRRRP